MNLKKQLDKLCGSDTGYWSLRLHSEIDYLLEALKEQSTYSDQVLRTVLDELQDTKRQNGALVKQDVLAAEDKLSMYVPLAKQYVLRMVSHAHIDMNWQWGFEETVGVVIDTFRTMLRLLEEYPQFIFTQSQASVYEIIEKYAPDLLPIIRQHIVDGRWEVIASTWVEADKNLCSTESMARQLLYTRQYLKDLLGLRDDQFEIDFEPDTFGHSTHVPEILSQAGVKYYYHCRGLDNEEAYRWQAPSGAEVLALRDPEWYMLIDMDYHMIYHVPSFCRKNHTDTALRFYGVGDHGGGPSRRDLERIQDMQTWPLAPKIVFSTLHGFFHSLEQARDKLPVLCQEHNFVFTGCYTSQARIKQANRHGEDHLYDTEALCAMARAMGCDMTSLPGFDEAWKKILFNQFHDILPGSGVRATREHALGISQEANARCLANANRALHAMGKRICTNAYPGAVNPDSFAESAGSGYNSCRATAWDTHFNIGSAGKSSGSVRPYTIFNPTQYDREEWMEITVWDWEEPLEGTRICDSEGNECPFDIVESGRKYWQHSYCKLGFVATVPAFGYANYYVMEADVPAKRIRILGAAGNNRIHLMNDAPVVLENDVIRAEFSRISMELVSLIDKKSGAELLSAPACQFFYNEEQDEPKHSAWIINPLGQSENLNQTCFVKMLDEKTDAVCPYVVYEISFRSSSLRVRVSLEPNNRNLRFSLRADWNERAVAGEFAPQLQFRVPFGYASDFVQYDVPGGTVMRPQLAHDVPAILYAAPVPKNVGPGLVMTSDCKYGYRTYDNTLCMTLFHCGYRPDPRPDTGDHQIEIGLGITDCFRGDVLAEYAICFSHPLYAFSNDCHDGDLPERGQLISVTGPVRVDGLKLSEVGQGITLRLTNLTDADHTAAVSCAGFTDASMTDILEQPLNSANMQSIFIPKQAIRTICLEREETL